MAQNIQVFVRVRPMSEGEEEQGLPPAVLVPAGSTQRIEVGDRCFTFDGVFGSTANQLDVYTDVTASLAAEVLAGYPCTVFAYGQTGSGKTHTMEGSDTKEALWNVDNEMGITPRSFCHIFDLVKNMNCSILVSYVEIYEEQVYDLLSPKRDHQKLGKVYEVANSKKVKIEGLTEVKVFNSAQAYHLMARGLRKRRTAFTLCNARSSRSHTIFTIAVHTTENLNDGSEQRTKIGKLNLVDLAGSENTAQSGVVGPDARVAGVNNKSLVTLGRVITALNHKEKTKENTHIPYRESLLTRLLADSLGGRTKTSIIATISPSANYIEETLKTLVYAQNARKITNRPKVTIVTKRTPVKDAAKQDEASSQAQYERIIEDMLEEAEQMRNALSESDQQISDLEKLIDTLKQQKDREVRSKEEELAASRIRELDLMKVIEEQAARIKSLEDQLEQSNRMDSSRPDSGTGSQSEEGPTNSEIPEGVMDLIDHLISQKTEELKVELRKRTASAGRSPSPLPRTPNVVITKPSPEAGGGSYLLPPDINAPYTTGLMVPPLRSRQIPSPPEEASAAEMEVWDPGFTTPVKKRGRPRGSAKKDKEIQPESPPTPTEPPIFLTQLDSRADELKLLADHPQPELLTRIESRSMTCAAKRNVPAAVKSALYKLKESSAQCPKLEPDQFGDLPWLLFRETQNTPGGILIEEDERIGTEKLASLVVAQLDIDSKFRSGTNQIWYPANEKVVKPVLLKVGGTLIICHEVNQKSTAERWKRVLTEKGIGAVNIIIYKGQELDRPLHDYDVVLTAKPDWPGILNIAFTRIILGIDVDDDGVPRFHSDNSYAAAVFRLRAFKRWIHTSAPVERDYLEGYVKFLRIEPFDQAAIWKARVSTARKNKHEDAEYTQSWLKKTVISTFINLVIPDQE